MTRVERLLVILIILAALRNIIPYIEPYDPCDYDITSRLVRMDNGEIRRLCNEVGSLGTCDRIEYLDIDPNYSRLAGGGFYYYERDINLPFAVEVERTEENVRKANKYERAQNKAT